MTLQQLTEKQFRAAIFDGDLHLALDLTMEEDQPRVRVWLPEKTTRRELVVVLWQVIAADGKTAYWRGDLALLGNL